MSNVMCASVAYSYCNMQWGIKYSCYSAPASVAFLLIIPYAVGISICAVLAWIFNKRSHKLCDCIQSENHTNRVVLALMYKGIGALPLDKTEIICYNHKAI